MSELDLLTGATQGLSAAYQTSAGIVDDVFSRIERLKTRFNSFDSLIRAYYFDVVGNIEFLEIIKKDAFKIDRRIINILKRFIMIKTKLDSLKQIRSLSR